MIDIYHSELLKEAGRECWLQPRPDEVKVKGKGLMKTFFLNAGRSSTTANEEEESGDTSPTSSEAFTLTDNDATKQERLVEWHVATLGNLLKKIVARNQRKGKRMSKAPTQTSLLGRTFALEEVTEVISLPDFDPNFTSDSVDPNTILLDKDVTDQLRQLVAKIGSLYK